MALNSADIIQDGYNYTDPRSFKYGYAQSILSGSNYHKDQGGSCPNVDKSNTLAKVFEKDYKCTPYTYYKNLIEKRNESCACTLARETARNMQYKDKEHDYPYYLSNLYCGQCEREILRLANSLTALKSGIINYKNLLYKNYQLKSDQELLKWIRLNSNEFYKSWRELINTYILEPKLRDYLDSSIQNEWGDINMRNTLLKIDDIIKNLNPMDTDKLNLIDINIRNYVRKNRNARNNRFVEIYKKFYELTE